MPPDARATGEERGGGGLLANGEGLGEAEVVPRGVQNP